MLSELEFWCKVFECKEAKHHQVGYIDFDDMQISIFCFACDAEKRMDIHDPRS